MTPTDRKPALHAGFDEAFLRGFIWAYVGAIFGAVFIGLLRVFELMELPVPAQIPAAALSGAVSALFYGSMRLAVIAAISGTLASFGFLALAAPPIHPLVIASTAGMAGCLLGGVYGFSMQTSRVCRADAKTLAGLSAGMVSALVLVGILLLAGELPLWLVTAILCPVTGIVYVAIVPWFIEHFENLLPSWGDGALVGGGVAAFVGLAIWVIVGEMHSQVVGTYAEHARHLLDRLPEAALGGILGAALAGFIGGLSGRAWQDL